MNALTISLAMLVSGADPTPMPPAPKRVLLLDDFQIVEGRVQQIGEIVRIEPGVGPARVVNRKQILLESSSRGDVHDYVASKLNLNSKDDLLRLSAWCEKVELWNEALQHARTAEEKAPGDAAVHSYVQSLEKKARAALEAKPESPAVASTATTPMTTPPSPAMPPSKASTDKSLAPPAETRIVYGQKIEPILMNRCGVCHARSSYTGAFKLMRVDPGYPNTGATVNNFDVVMNQLLPGDPRQSPLLVKSIVVHGDQKTPGFFDRNHVAYHTLEAWVLSVLPAVTAAVPAKPAATPVVSRPAPLPASIPAATAVVPRGFAVDAVASMPPGSVPPMKTATTASATAPTTATMPAAPAKAVPVSTVVPIPTTAQTGPGTVVPAVAATTQKPQPPKSVVTRNPNDPFDPAIFNNLPK